MMEFLYFPEDKSEYIPAIITLVIFMIGAAITTYFFIKQSRKAENKLDERYRLNKKDDEDTGPKKDDSDYQ